jgi:peptidoglycan-associated lipoprotein
VSAFSDNGGACSFPEIHFAFDDATLDSAARDGLQRMGECLQREANTHYVLIGRADPRGTAEYNVALGSRRARVVQHYLTALGVVESRLDVSSLGSAGATGSDEASWARDRRVDTTRQAGAHP